MFVSPLKRKMVNGSVAVGTRVMVAETAFGPAASLTLGEESVNCSTG
jgi:hypothetical protein